MSVKTAGMSERGTLVADLILLAGQMILENGGETYRVEETMVRMALACGVEAADVFAIPPGIFFTLTLQEGSFTRVARIHQRGFNLAKVLEVNRISRELTEGRVDPQAAYRKLLQLKQMPRRYSAWIHMLAGAGASASFAYLLGAHAGSLFMAGITGFLVIIVVDVMLDRGIPYFVSVALGGAVAASANLLAKAFLPSLQFDLAVVGSLMTLVPGVAITTSVRDALSEDLVSASIRGFEAFGIALAIAAGVGIMLVLYLRLGGMLP